MKRMINIIIDRKKKEIMSKRYFKKNRSMRPKQKVKEQQNTSKSYTKK